MSLYNMINGVNPATFFILPMLGKHPDEYPRFRDCWAGKTSTDEENDQFGIPVIHNNPEDKMISVYTRVGGCNRDNYEEEINKLRAIPEYIRDFDDDFDCTFATFEFKVPEKWIKDYDVIVEGKIQDISKEYKAELYKVYPKLKEKLDTIFK